MFSKLFRASMVMTVAVMLTSCTFLFDTNLQRDGSGTVELGFHVPLVEARAMEAVGDISLEEICSQADFGAGSGRSVDGVFVEEDGMVSCTAMIAFDNVQDLAGIYEDYGVDVDTLGKQAQRFEFDAVLDLEDIGMDDIIWLEDVEVDADIEWRLTMPGTPVESNADEVDDSTFVWHVVPGERLEMQASSRVGGIPFAVLNVAAAAASVLVLIGGFLLITRRHAVQPGENEKTNPPG